MSPGELSIAIAIGAGALLIAAAIDNLAKAVREADDAHNEVRRD